MNDEYFEWLLNIIGIDRNDENGYSMLCAILHDIVFYPIIDMDENRWEDGVRYRYDFAVWHQGGDTNSAEAMADQLDTSLGGCTVLEMMVALAEEMMWEMEDSAYEAPASKWFEEMIGNLGLDLYTNRELMENESAYFEVENTAENLVFRRYHYNGEGGLFPLQEPYEDQRETEIAIQMNRYLMENYDILT